MNKSDWQDDLTLSSQSKRVGYSHAIGAVSSRDTRVRVRLLWVVYAMGIALLGAKVMYMQVIARGQHELSSYANHIELKRELAPRGVVYDRMGVPLVENKASEGKYERVYPLGSAIAPVMGYVSQVREDEIGCYDGLCYAGGMERGRAGIEQVMESRLRGRDGGKLVEVDASGTQVRELGNNLAESGSDITLSIDAGLQQLMYDSLRGKKGSAVAIDMQGRVLGLVSSPAYDPANVADYLSDKEQLYFLNRAIAGTYPPGSVFKLVTTLAGLTEGKIESDTEYEDTGEIKIGEYRYGNWYFDKYGRTEGKINLAKALARSNDIYFYKLGEEIGVDTLVKWARRFGLGQETGIELPTEQSGLVPDRLWKERATGEPWFLGNTYHMAIGQGDLLVTPLQVARMTLGAVSGRLCKITLFMDSDAQCEDLGITTEDLAIVRDGMRQTCATGGTAFPFFNADPWVMCKTGTAEHSGQSVSTEEKVIKPHAWITVAYPGENPELILSVMLEAAGEGSEEAAPIAKVILDGWKAMGK